MQDMSGLTTPYHNVGSSTTSSNLFYVPFVKPIVIIYVVFFFCLFVVVLFCVF